MDRPVKKQKKKKLCMDAALTYLGTRMRSEYEMRSYLQKKQYREDEIEQTIERLKGYGYIDNNRYNRDLYLDEKTSSGKFAAGWGNLSGFIV